MKADQTLSPIMPRTWYRGSSTLSAGVSRRIGSSQSAWAVTKSITCFALLEDDLARSNSNVIGIKTHLFWYMSSAIETDRNGALSHSELSQIPAQKNRPPRTMTPRATKIRPTRSVLANVLMIRGDGWRAPPPPPGGGRGGGWVPGVGLE